MGNLNPPPAVDHLELARDCRTIAALLPDITTRRVLYRAADSITALIAQRDETITALIAQRDEAITSRDMAHSQLANAIDNGNRYASQLKRWEADWNSAPALHQYKDLRAVAEELNAVRLDRDKARAGNDALAAELDKARKKRDEFQTAADAWQEAAFEAEAARDQARKERDEALKVAENSEKWANRWNELTNKIQDQRDHDIRKARAAAEEEAAAAVAMADRYKDSDAATVRIVARILRATFEATP